MYVASIKKWHRVHLKIISDISLTNHSSFTPGLESILFGFWGMQKTSYYPLRKWENSSIVTMLKLSNANAKQC